ncbi:hypothetical protein [Vibrio sp. YIC-376]|uniref:hypothetical protein n=1 Tax=Vibrio sp. YIC-376 TaxID=3136162 RepID=UPI00402A88AC
MRITIIAQFLLWIGIVFSSLSVSFVFAEDEQVLYGLSSHQDLYTIDAPSGAITYVGSIGLNQNNAISLAYNPLDGSLLTYARGGDQFLTLSPTNGNSSVLSSSSIDCGIGGLAFDSMGVLYSVDSLLDALAIFDPSTSLRTFIGNSDFPFGGGLSFNSNDELFVIAEGRDLHQLDLDNGASTVIGNINDGQPHASTWLGLAFDGQDVLYTTRREFTPNGVITDLYTIDSATGNATFVSNLSGFVTAGDSIIRLVFFGQASNTVEQQINILIEEIISMNIKSGISNSLDAKLSSAIQALDDNLDSNDIAALNSLYAFCNSVSAQSGGVISTEEAATLIAKVNAIIDNLDDAAASCE